VCVVARKGSPELRVLLDYDRGALARQRSIRVLRGVPDDGQACATAWQLAVRRSGSMRFGTRVPATKP